MTLDLLKRGESPSALTAEEHDANLTAIEDEVNGKSATGHAHATTDITSGTFADARIAESNVTQHQAALSIATSQLSDGGALALLDEVTTGEIASSAYASQAEAEAATENTKLITALRVLQQLFAQFGRTTRLDLESGSQNHILQQSDNLSTIVFHSTPGSPTVTTDATITGPFLVFLACEQDVDQTWSLDVDATTIVHVGSSDTANDESVTLNKSSRYALLNTGTTGELFLLRFPGHNEIGSIAALNEVTWPGNIADGTAGKFAMWLSGGSPGLGSFGAGFSVNTSTGEVTASTGGSVTPTTVTSANSPYTALSTDERIVCEDGANALEVIIPSALSNTNQNITIIRGTTHTGTATVTAGASTTVAGTTNGTAFTIEFAGAAVEIAPSAEDVWQIISGGGATNLGTSSHANHDFNGYNIDNIGDVILDDSSSSIQCVDGTVSRPELKDYSETSTTPSSSSGTLTLDMETGNCFEVTLTEDITTLTISNPPASGKLGSVTMILIQDSTPRTLDWGSILWEGGTAPTISTGSGAVDIYTLMTRDGGTTWYGFTGGQAFA